MCRSDINGQNCKGFISVRIALCVYICGKFRKMFNKLLFYEGTIIH